jgi:DNA-binding CsgD family transcriptional regulator
MGSAAHTLEAETHSPATGSRAAAANGDDLLVRVARPVMDRLARDLAGTGIGVVLTNAHRQVVDRRASEPPVGAHPDLTGPATPIVDSRSGQTVGALELTCSAADGNPLIRPLAALAAREIEQRLVEEAGLAERLALGRFLQERRGAKGPFVLVTQRRLIPNAAADRLVGPADEPALREAADRLRDARRGDIIPLVLGGGAVAVRAQPVGEGGTPDGIVLQLRPLARGAGGSGPGRERTSWGWASLTDTERSVAHVVAEGLTNREAAERLFLSPHTVDFHLRSIFRKLGASSRVHLTRLVVLTQHNQGET